MNRNCPSCKSSNNIPEEWKLPQWKCGSCGKSFQIAQAASAAEPDEITIVDAPRVARRDAGSKTGVNPSQQTGKSPTIVATKKDGMQECPLCGNLFPATGHLCVSCGLDIRTGRRQDATKVAAQNTKKSERRFFPDPRLEKVATSEKYANERWKSYGGFFMSLDQLLLIVNYGSMGLGFAVYLLALMMAKAPDGSMGAATKGALFLVLVWVVAIGPLAFVGMWLSTKLSKVDLPGNVFVRLGSLIGPVIGWPTLALGLGYFLGLSEANADATCHSALAAAGCFAAGAYVFLFRNRHDAWFLSTAFGAVGAAVGLLPAMLILALLGGTNGPSAFAWMTSATEGNGTVAVNSDPGTKPEVKPAAPPVAARTGDAGSATTVPAAAPVATGTVATSGPTNGATNVTANPGESVSVTPVVVTPAGPNAAPAAAPAQPAVAATPEEIPDLTLTITPETEVVAGYPAVQARSGPWVVYQVDSEVPEKEQFVRWNAEENKAEEKVSVPAPFTYRLNAKIDDRGDLVARLMPGAMPSVQVFSFTAGRIIGKVNAVEGPATPTLLGFAGRMNVVVVFRAPGGETGFKQFNFRTAERVNQGLLPSFVPSTTNYAISADGAYLAMVSVESDLSAVHVFNLLNGREMTSAVLAEDTVTPRGMSFSRDSKTLAVEYVAAQKVQIKTIDLPGGAAHDVTVAGMVDRGQEPLAHGNLTWLPDGNGWLVGGTEFVSRADGRVVGTLRLKNMLDVSVGAENVSGLRRMAEGGTRVICVGYDAKKLALALGAVPKDAAPASAP